MSWFLRGMAKGVMTEKFPMDQPIDVAPWLTELRGSGEAWACPTNAIKDGEWSGNRCIFCRRYYPNYSLTSNIDIFSIKNRNSLFVKSFYIYPIDIGTCGGCNMELKMLSSSQYDMSRFGIFFTNTPRHADALIVMGVLTEDMRDALIGHTTRCPSPNSSCYLGPARSAWSST